MTEIIIRNGYQLLNLPEEALEKLLDPLLNKTGLAMLTGTSDIGKSSLLRHLSYAIVTGQEELWGFKLSATHRKVLYISTEDTDTDVSRALKKLHRSEKEAIEIEGLKFLFNFSDEFENLDDYLKRNPVDLMIVDCWADLLKGSPNDLATVRQSLMPFKHLALKHSCLVLYMHHSAKRSEEKTPDKNLVNGSQAIEAIPRFVMELRKGDTPTQRLLTVVKCNYLSSEFKDESIVLDFDEATLSFSRAGSKPLDLQGVSKVKYQNQEVYDRLIGLKDQGLSFEKCREMLLTEYRDKEVPGLTSLKAYYLKNKNRS